MTKPDLELLLDQLCEAASLAVSYVDGLDKIDFQSDRRTQQAVTMNLIIIGEVANRVLTEYPDFAAQPSAIPWRGMRNMRNRIAHGYYSIDFDVVWITVKLSLPQLLKDLATSDIS